MPLLFGMFFATPIFASQPGATVTFHPKRDSWTIGNRFISLTYCLAASGAIQLESLKNLQDGVEWAGDPSQRIFRFDYTANGSGERTVDSQSGWRLQGWKRRSLSSGRKELFLKLVNADAQWAVELHVQCANGYPVIRRWYRIENESKQERILLDAAVVSDPIKLVRPIKVMTYKFDTHGTFLRPSPPKIERLSGGGFEKATGSLAYSPMMMLRTGDGRGLFWGWAYSGRTYFGIERRRGALLGAAEVSFLSLGHRKNGNFLSYQLDPGQDFTTPEQVVGVFQGDWDEGCYQLQRYADRWFSGITPNHPAYPLTVIDSWGAYSIHEAKLKKVIDWASKAGIEAMDIDYGWAIAGDWRPRRLFFPSGSMASLSGYAKRKGIKLIVHLPFGDVDHASKVYQKHPDWTYGKPWKLWKDETGREGIASSLCLTNETARMWMLNRISESIQENKLIGFDADAFLFTPDNIPCKFLSGAASKAAPEYSQYMFGLDPFLEGLLRRHKGLVIENAGGAMGPPVYDFSTARFFSHTISTVSIPVDQRVPEYIRANYYITYLVSSRWPAEYFAPTASAGVRLLSDNNTAQKEVKDPGRLRLNDFCLRIFLLGGSFYLELNPARLNAREQALLIKYVRMFKQLRSWTSGGEVLHLMNPGPSPDWNGWVALGDYSPEEDRAVVIVWHYQGGQEEMTIPMKGLVPDQKYAVLFADSGRKFTASGLEIMQKGLQVSLDPYPEKLSNKSSEIIFINPGTVGSRNEGYTK